MSETTERVRVTVNAGGANLKKGLGSSCTTEAVQIVGLLINLSYGERVRALTMAVAMLKAQGCELVIPDWCMRS